MNTFWLVIILLTVMLGSFFAVMFELASKLPQQYYKVECVNLPAPVVDNSTQVRLDACIGKLYELQNKYWVNGSWCGK